MPPIADQMSADNSAKHNPRLGMRGTVGLAPASEHVKPLGTGTIQKYGVVGGASDIGGEGDLAAFGERRFKAVRLNLRPQLHFDHRAQFAGGLRTTVVQADSG